MSGRMALTIRRRDGREHRLCVGKTIVPTFINNMGLLADDNNAYLDAFLGKLPTDADLFDQPLAPYDYGLVVVDCVTHTLLSMQGFCNIGAFSGFYAIPQVGYTDERQRFKAFADAGRVKSVRSLNKTQTFTSPQTWEFIEDMSQPEPLTWLVDMSPFTVVDLNEYNDCGGHEPDVVAQCWKLVMEMKFEISATDQAAWHTYVLKHRDENTPEVPAAKGGSEL